MNRYLCRWEDRRGKMHSAVMVVDGIRHVLMDGRAKKRMPDMAVYALSDNPSAMPTPVRLYYDYVFDRVQIYDLTGHKLDSAGLPIRGQYTWDAVST